MGSPRSRTHNRGVYGLIRAYGRAMVGSWYRVEAHGEALPERGAMILYANHNGGLVDGGLMWFLTGRQLRFIAKYTLLKMPLLGLLIRAAGTIPVYRKKDKVDTSLNQSSFAAIDAALLAGEAIVLYPEGEGGTEPFVRPFKTGTARMALSALEASKGALELRLVPVGITYEDQDRYRSVLHATVGKAVTLGDLGSEEAGPAAVAHATARIREALRALLPEHEAREQVAASRLAAELVPARGRTLQVRMRAVVAGLARLREAAPARATRLQEELQRCAQELRGLGLRGGDLESPPSWGEVLVAAPAALISGLLRLAVHAVWAPAYWPARTVAKRFAPADKVVTFTLIGSSFAGVAWAAGAAAWGWSKAGPAAAAAALLVLGAAWWLAGHAREAWDASTAVLRTRLLWGTRLTPLRARVGALRTQLTRRSEAQARLLRRQATA